MNYACLAVTVIYSWNMTNNKGILFVRLQVEHKNYITIKLSLPSLTPCLCQPSIPVQKKAVVPSSLHGLPPYLPHPYWPPWELGWAGVPCRLWDRRVFSTPLHTPSIWARALSLNDQAVEHVSWCQNKNDCADGYCTVQKDLGNIPHENSLLKVFL